jgi:hypothetical protein
MVRPSDKSTVNASSSILTPCAAGSLSCVSEVFIPRSQQQLAVIPDEQLYLPHLDRRKAMAVFKANRIEPKLGSVPLALDMDVRRFISE